MQQLQLLPYLHSKTMSLRGRSRWRFRLPRNWPNPMLEVLWHRHKKHWRRVASTSGKFMGTVILVIEI